jgi:nucleotide-binding universal stress UspA family protein
MYLNLAAFAVVVLVIAIWTTDNAVLIPAVIVSGIFIGINNTVTTQAVMTVSPVERPVASSAYSFVRFIGGGLAPYAAGRLVMALNIHVPFYIGSGAILLGIVILFTGHRLLDDAERVQAQQVAAAATGAGAPVAASGPASAMIPVGATTPQPDRRPSQGVILAAVDQTPVAGLVTEAAARLALADGQIVYVVHAQESVTAGDVGVEAEDLDAARDLVRAHLDRLAAHHVPAEGQVLLHAADHGGAGRFIAEYATSIRATTIVVGAPSHGGLSALMDESASQELMRHTSSNVLIINPAAPVTGNGPAAVAMAQGSGSGRETA